MARKKNGGFSWGAFFVGVGTAWGIGAATSLALWKLGGWAFVPVSKGELPTPDGGGTDDVPTPTPDDPLEGEGQSEGTMGGGPTAVQVDQPEGSEFSTRSKQGWGDFTVLLRPVQVEGPGETQVAWEWLVWEPATTTLAEGNTAGKGQRVGPDSFALARADAYAYVDMWGGEQQFDLAD